MQTIVGFIMLPLAAVNMVGALAVAIWLGFLGDWGSVGWGVLFSAGGAGFGGVLMMPGLYLAHSANPLMKKGNFWKPLGGVLALAGLVWSFGVPAAWGLLAADFFTARAGADSQMAHLAWILFVTALPWSYMASKEGNEFTLLPTASVQIAAVYFLVMREFAGQDLSTVIYALAGIMAAGFAVSVFSGGLGQMLQALTRRQQAIASRQRALEER